MAKELLSEDDTILIESDLIFDSKILSKLIENPTKNLVLVEKHKPWMDGTVVKLDNDFTITHLLHFSYYIAQPLASNLNELTYVEQHKFQFHDVYFLLYNPVTFLL